MAADGSIIIGSSFGPKETMDRLEAEVKANGITVFALIDHAVGAVEVGLPLRPTELLIFGNAKARTLLMQANQGIGAIQGAGIRGCGRQDLAVIQLSALVSALACTAARARRDRRSDCRLLWRPR